MDVVILSHIMFTRLCLATRRLHVGVSVHFDAVKPVTPRNELLARGLRRFLLVTSSSSSLAFSFSSSILVFDDDVSA